MDNQNNNFNNNNNNHNNFNRDRNQRDHGHFNNRNRDFNNNRGFGGNREQRFNNDVTFKDKTDDQIVQILLDKQKKIGRNLFGSDIHPLYELIIRQNKRIKALEEKLNNSNNNEVNQ